MSLVRALHAELLKLKRTLAFRVIFVLPLLIALLQFLVILRTKTYSRGLLSRVSTTALNNVSLKLESEQSTIMTVAGESGSGKTTLAMLLLGFISPTSGQNSFHVSFADCPNAPGCFNPITLLQESL